jgi:hypothetical protein
MLGEELGPDELRIIRTVFDGFDIEREGKIHINQLPSLLSKLNKSQEDVVTCVEHCSSIADENEGRITFDDVIHALKKIEKAKNAPVEGPDPKVLQFLSILEEYRLKCEEEGNYLEASRAYKQLGVLRKQEEKRQQKVIQARHISERQDVQLAHNMQFSEFNKQWDKYLTEYDQMAQMYIQQMTERHALVLLEFQKQLRDELQGKPPKWSRALLDQRRKQHINARNKNYALAQKLKKLSDINEEKERRALEQSQAVAFARREAKFRMQQQSELQALLKRIECRRKEHIKQRELDTKRLLQRNRNVQAVLENKQAAESQKLFAEIKKVLYSNAVLQSGMSESMKKKMHASASAPMTSTQPHHNTMHGVSQQQRDKSSSPTLQQQQHYDQGQGGGGGNYYQQGGHQQGDQQQGYYDDNDNGEAVEAPRMENLQPNFAAMVYEGADGEVGLSDESLGEDYA